MTSKPTHIAALAFVATLSAAPLAHAFAGRPPGMETPKAVDEPKAESTAVPELSASGISAAFALLGATAIVVRSRRKAQLPGA